MFMIIDFLLPYVTRMAASEMFYTRFQEMRTDECHALRNFVEI